MLRLRAAITLFAALLLVVTACGDDDVADPGTTAAPGGGTTQAPADDEMGDTGSVDFPDAAPAGEARLMVGGESHVATVNESCDIGEDFFLFSATTESGLEVGGNGSRPGSNWAAQLIVNVDGDTTFSSGTSLFDASLNAEAMTEGSTLFWAGPFSVYADGIPTGDAVDGRLSVTCP